MKKLPETETRNSKELVEHYNLETRLALILRNANRQERKELYTKLYNEMYEKIPYFSEKARNTAKRRNNANQQIDFLNNFKLSEVNFMEIGPGDCALSIALCKTCKQVFAVDISFTIPGNIRLPENLNLIVSNGISIDIKDGDQIDIAYSNQLMEHLHPEDVKDQLRNIFNVLVRKGLYIIITPHRFTGPHDISKYFDDVATGFHLKEYTNSELNKILKAVGFRWVYSYTQIKGHFFRLPLFPTEIIETVLEPLPNSIRRFMFQRILIRHLLPIRIVAVK